MIRTVTWHKSSFFTCISSSTFHPFASHLGVLRWAYLATRSRSVCIASSIGVDFHSTGRSEQGVLRHGAHRKMRSVAVFWPTCAASRAVLYANIYDVYKPNKQTRAVTSGKGHFSLQARWIKLCLGCFSSPSRKVPDRGMHVNVLARAMGVRRPGVSKRGRAEWFTQVLDVCEKIIKCVRER